MDVYFKDILAWCVTAVSVAGAFFHLRSRVSVIEALQKRDRETAKDASRDIKDILHRIEDKLNHKADK